jgi:RHS repeat-associated protein
VLWKLVGNDTRGCDIEPIIDQQNPNNPAMQATITAGSQNGPITVKATVSFHCGDSPPYDDTIVLEANLELCGATDDESGPNGCGICGGRGPSDGSDPNGRLSAGTAVALNRFGPDFALNLGRADYLSQSGTLTFGTRTPAQASPALLDLPYLRTQVTRIPATGSIQQVKMPEGLVKVETIDNYSFELRVYYNSQVSGPVNGYYVTQGDPYVTWSIANPNNNTNQFRFRETRGSSVMREFYFAYDSATNRWTETDLDGLRTVVRWEETDGQQRTNAYLEIKSGTVVLERKRWVYETINSRQVLTQYEEGVAPTLRTTTYAYYTNGENAGLIKSIDYPDGRWEYLCYEDSERRVTCKYEAYQNSTRPADGSVPDPSTCKLTEYGYSLSADSDGVYDPGVGRSHDPRKMMVKLLNHASAVTYVHYTFFSDSAGGSRLESEESRRCPTPGSGAAWTNSDNLRTVTWYWNDLAHPEFLGRVLAELHQDGTVTCYNYTTNQDGTVAMTECRGQGNGTEPPTSVLEGTKSTTRFDDLGLVLERTTVALAGGSEGPVLAHDTYNYMQPPPNNTEYLDPLRRDHDVTDLAGRTSQFRYTCCALSHTVDPDGVTTYYDYDTLGRLYSTRRVVDTTPTETWIHTLLTLDAAGRVLVSKRIGTDGNAANAVLLQQTAYDVLGRVIRQTNGLGGVTTNLYLTNANSLRDVVLYPDGGTRTNDYRRDGSLEQSSGTAVFGVYYERGVEQDGGSNEPWREYTKETKLKTNYTLSDEWTLTYADGTGRTYKTLYAPRPGTDSTPPFSQTWYNGLGQAWKQCDPDGVTTLFAFNGQGEAEYTIQALTTETLALANYSDLQSALSGGTLFSGVDRLTRITNYALASGASGNSRGVDIRRSDQYVWKDGESSGTLVSRSEASTDGLQAWQSMSPGGSSPEVTSQTFTTLATSANTWTRTVTQIAPDGSQTVSVYQHGRLQSTTRQDNTAKHNQVAQTTFGYDPHGRQSTVTDARNGATTYSYNAADLIASVTTPNPGTLGAAAQQTVTYYNAMLQATNVVQPDGRSVFSQYFPNGLLQKTWGAREYPVEYTYDYAGRRKTLTTWQQFNQTTGQGISGSATTTWNYNTNRGWLDSKVYADNQGPSYTYTAAGRLQTRAWARNVGGQRLTTSYTYGNAGDLETVTYSDNSPGVSYAYDRLGRRRTSTQNDLTTTLAYNDASQLLSESYSGGPLNGLSVTNGYDPYDRRATLALLSPNGTVLHRSSYDYDEAGRLQTVSDVADNGATYEYLANSPLVGQISFTANSLLRMTTTNQYDNLNRLRRIASVSSAASVVSFDYAYNAANQRTRARLADGSFWAYEYDALGQVTSGKRFWSDWTPVAGQQFEYAFDQIGNRKGTEAGGDRNGWNLRDASYQANAVNQYTSRTVPGGVDIMGVAWGTNSVLVNGQLAERKGEYFRSELGVNNSTGPVWQAVTVTNSGGNAVSGHLLVPSHQEGLTYDADGNLTSDTLWTNTWNAENRRIVVESSAGVSPATARAREEWTYLSDGRWIERIVSTNHGNAYYPAWTNRYVWDGNVLLAVLDHTNGLVLSFLRGLDLSGSLEGAGGVGGLAAVCGPTNGTHFAAYDGNGNVSALVSASDGTVSADYAYGPFGEMLRMTGTMAKANPLRFSTQYADDITSGLMYLFRDYAPTLGRWLSRDPIGEGGFRLVNKQSMRPVRRPAVDLNDFCFLGNSSQSHFDILGLLSKTAIKPCCNGIGPPHSHFRDCEAACARARNDWFFYITPGGVMCNGDKPCPCLAPFPKLGYAPGMCPAIDEVLMEHEKAHLPFAQCRKCGLYPAEPPRGMDWQAEECKQRKKTMEQLVLMEGTLEPECAEVARHLIEFERRSTEECQ